MTHHYAAFEKNETDVFGDCNKQMCFGFKH